MAAEVKKPGLLIWLPVIALLLGLLGTLVRMSYQGGRIASEFEELNAQTAGLRADFTDHLRHADSLERAVEKTRIIACVANGSPLETCVGD